MKVFWLFNHPAPYKIDFFNVLGKDCELDVIFERASEAGRNSIFYGERPCAFSAEIANSLKLGGINNYTRLPLKRLKQKSYDVVVLNGWMTFTEQATIRYCRHKKIPYIFYINGGIAKEKESPILRSLKKKYISGANLYFAPDAKSASYLTFYGAKKEDIVLYPYSSVFEEELISSPSTAEEKKTLREELNLQGSRVFVSSGQFIERKNFEELISLWKSMPQEDFLYITGEGPLKEKYLGMIEELGLKNVILLPYLNHSKLLHFFRACDAFVFLSKEDIYGHVVNEAMSQGLPVIAGENVNAARHLIADGENGFVVKLGEEEAIRKAILSSLDPSFQEKALSSARKNTIEASAAFHLSAFKKYLEGLKK